MDFKNGHFINYWQIYAAGRYYIAWKVAGQLSNSDKFPAHQLGEPPVPL